LAKRSSKVRPNSVRVVLKASLVGANTVEIILGADSGAIKSVAFSACTKSSKPKVSASWATEGHVRPEGVSTASIALTLLVHTLALRVIFTSFSTFRPGRFNESFSPNIVSNSPKTPGGRYPGTMWYLRISDRSVVFCFSTSVVIP